MNMQEITGIKVDYSQLPADYNSSMHPEAVKYRKALARASNAIEGVVLTDNDKAFMDSIPVGMPKDEFIKVMMKYILSQRTY
ncbi:MAG: hypothetical protein Q4G13_09805 [Moraxella sp.]|nr:hypothetical protein [Moraxella sp.]